MGPDLFGIVWATAFVVAVVLVFAAVDRAICGAWAALRESPGLGLVAGLAAWGWASRTAHLRRDIQAFVGRRA